MVVAGVVLADVVVVRVVPAVVNVAEGAAVVVIGGLPDGCMLTQKVTDHKFPLFLKKKKKNCYRM